MNQTRSADVARRWQEEKTLFCSPFLQFHAQASQAVFTPDRSGLSFKQCLLEATALSTLMPLPLHLLSKERLGNSLQ